MSTDPNPARWKPTTPPVRWSCRYSSSEMLYLELTPTGVRSYLDHSPGSAEHTDFADILAGKLDGEVTNLFGADTLAQLKAAAKARIRSDGPA